MIETISSSLTAVTRGDIASLCSAWNRDMTVIATLLSSTVLLCVILNPLARAISETITARIERSCRAMP